MRGSGNTPFEHKLRIHAHRRPPANSSRFTGIISLPAGGGKSTEGVPGVSPDQKPFRRTHDLGDLSSDCLTIAGTLQASVTYAASLTQYAWRFRYAGSPYEFSDDHTKLADFYKGNSGGTNDFTSGAHDLPEEVTRAAFQFHVTRVFSCEYFTLNIFAFIAI